MIYSFKNDYCYGAHERIMEELFRINREQVNSYGNDEYTEAARTYIRREIRRDSDVYFLAGGTQTNLAMIAATLRPWQGVISADIGHIAGHEAGAIEATGHKVLVLPSKDGKLTADQIYRCIKEHWSDPARTHEVQPGMVYLSHPTEVGTLYSKEELTAISHVCRENSIFLYIDGARLGCALTAATNDLELYELAALTDAFFIGGTKMGGLFGEALVINNPAFSQDFLYVMKQRGGRLCKGWLVGLQFAELFRDGLYYELGRSANAAAERLAQGMRSMGIRFFAPTVTNQLFPILPDDVIKRLAEDYLFISWDKVGRETAIRLVTSWATPTEIIDRFLQDLKSQMD